VREAELFFPELADRVLAEEDVECAPPPGDLGVRESVSAFAVLVDLKLALARGGPVSAEARERLLAELARERPLALARVKDATTLRAIAEGWAAQAEAARAPAWVDARAREAFLALLEFDWGGGDFDRLAAGLRRAAAPLSAWDELILRCQRFHGALR
jgi:hypothetical protein